MKFWNEIKLNTTRVSAVIIFFLVVWAFVYSQVNLQSIQKSYENLLDLNDTSEWKHIFFATSYWGQRAYWYKVFNRQIKGTCPESRCILHINHSNISNMDAVVFNGADLPANEKDALKNLPNPANKNPDQVWVFLSAESPSSANVQNLLKVASYRNFFNWTMTYRADSDVHFPFGLILPTDSDQEDISSLIPSTSKPPNKVVWMVSRCKSPSKREDFVEKLQSYIKVDIYGKCGKKCGQRNTIHYADPNKVDPCDELMKTYYFYLALENSICKDYVTEKFYRSLKLGLIPVVFRRADYYFAPQESFISVDDFKSVKDLAAYLDKVMVERELYLKYHNWRRNYRIELGLPFNPLVCELCQKLHAHSVPMKVYEDISAWFTDESECVPWNYKS